MWSKSVFSGERTFDRNVLTDLLFLLVFILSGSIGRVLLVNYGFQPFPNFEVIMVTTFLAALFLRPVLAFFVPVGCMVISDFLLGNPIFVGSGMNRIVLFTYSGFAMVGVIGIVKKRFFRDKIREFNLKSVGFAAGFGVFFVLIYDVWTNFGWWYLIYPHRLETLVGVYAAGVPFMVYHLLSGVFTFVVIALPVVSFITEKHEIEIPMSVKNIHKVPMIAVVLSLVVLSFTGTAMELPGKSEIWLEHSDETSVKIVVIGENWRVEDNVVVFNEETVFNLLKQVAKRNNFELEYTFYEQYNAYLIDSINGLENGEGGMYWQYYVNDELPMVGSDHFLVSNGDVVKWVFEKTFS